ncbi:MAG TPA: PIN domain-containing protein [Candidatus Dormibacteraeota bacterium]|nr:PIN domain-containing protein [Candidatus Dormibacteraeota bacterium]
MILLDTNVLVYAMNEASPRHRPCRAVVDLAMRARMPAVLVPQVLLECLSVVTSPRRVERPLTPEVAVDQLARLRRALPVMEVKAATMVQLEDLVRRAGRSGPRVYDLFLAAQMRVHGIRELCTENGRDFAGLGPAVRSPAQVLADYA